MFNDVRAQLWDFAYDLLSEAEQGQVRSRITSDPLVAREYVRVMQQVELLRRVAKAAETIDTLDFPAPADSPRTPYPETRLSPTPAELQPPATHVGQWWLTGAAALLAIVLLTLAGREYWSPQSSVRPTAVQQTWESIASDYPRVLITGPTQLHAGVEASYQALVQRMDGPPVVTRLSAELASAQGKVVWRSSRLTDSGGEVRFQVTPASEAGPYKLSIHAPDLSAQIPLTHLEQGPLFATWLQSLPPPEARWQSVSQAQWAELGVRLTRSIDLSEIWQSRDELVDSPASHATAQFPVSAQVQAMPGSQLDDKVVVKSEVPPPPASENSASPTSQQTKQIWMVEGLSYEDGAVGSRFVLPHMPHDASAAGSDDAEPASPWYDFTFAPPLKISGRNNQPVMRWKPLDIQIDFDRPAYKSGDPVRAKVRVSGFEAESSSVQLAIAVEGTKQDRSAPIQLGYSTNLGINQPPLVFDNGPVQLRKIHAAFGAWCSQRNARRQFIAIALLFGGGIGYTLILCQSLMKWLPPMMYWLPIMAALAVCFVLGGLWMMLSDPPEPPVAMEPLLNYGVRHERPPEDPSPNGESRSLPADDVDAEAPDMAADPVELPSAAFWWQWLQKSTGAPETPAATSVATYATLTFNPRRFAGNRWRRFAQTSATPTPPESSPGVAYWHPLVDADPTGTATITFRIPDEPAGKTWALHVEAQARDQLGTRDQVIPQK